MGGYANSGDADNGTAIDPQTRLGGDDGHYGLSHSEILIIVLVIAFAISVLITFLYYRKLEARRRYDLERNQTIELRGGAKHGDRGGSSSSNTTFGPSMAPSRPTTPHGNPTPAQEEDPFGTPKRASSQGAASNGISHPEPAVLSPSKAIAGAGCSADQKKPPLWKYIHWKEGPPKKKKTRLSHAERGNDTV